MADTPSSPHPSPSQPPSDPLLSTASLPPEQAEAVRRLVRERDQLFLLHEALLRAERVETLEGQLRIFVEAIRQIGFGRAVITVRDEELDPTLIVASGLTTEEERALREAPASGDAWRRRLAALEPFRISQSFYCDGRDPAVAREFRERVPSRMEPGDDPTWSPRDALIVPIKGSAGRIVATLVLDDPEDRSRPSLARVRAVELFGQQVAHQIEQFALGDLARRRSARLQRLQEAGAALARSLDEGEIVRELARQVQRVLHADGIVVAHPDIDAATVTTSLRLVRGVERSRPVQPLGAGPLAEVARSGRPVRIADFDPARVPAAAADDLVGDGAPAASVLAVPMMLGGQLIGVLAVHDAGRGAYTGDDEEVLLTLGTQAAAAIANARLYAESLSERRQSEALADIARAVGESLHLHEVLHLILRHTSALLRTHGADVGLLEGEELNIVAGVGDCERVIGMRLPVEGTMSGRAIRSRSSVIANDVLGTREEYWKPTQAAANVHKTLIVPLITARGPVGALSVVNRDADFTDADARILHRLADQVAVAIVNARLFEEVADRTREWHALAERHRSVVETAIEAIVITDLQRRIAYANPAALELFGGREDIIGRPISDFVPPEAADSVARHVDGAMAGAPQRYESVLLRLDGERRLVALSTAPMRDGDRITGLVACVRDITDERRARDAVAQSEARYRNLFESASDAIYTLDARGAFTSANDATCAVSGFSRDELLGRTTAALMDPDEIARVKAEFRAALDGESRRYECALIRRDGERRLLSVTNTPIRQRDRVIGVLGVARDVTEERLSAEALERSEARYTRLVESASDAIFTADAAGRFTSVNRALEMSVGMPREALVGSPFTDVVDPRDREPMWRLFEETMAGQRTRGEFRYRGADGEMRTGWAITAPIVEHGVVAGALGVVRDVTEERRLTDQLLQQEKLAAIGQLVSGVAHELNNPLAGVMAFSQLLLASPGVSPDTLAGLETIHQESRRAAKIVKNLLTFARQHPPERRMTSLNDVLLDTLELRRYALRVQQIDLAIALDDTLPATWADGFQLQQVFLNLLANAEQAMADHEGAKRLSLRSWREGERLFVAVADTGPGIAPENVDRVFNPFYTTKPVGQGTGLGLSISDGIVRQHGGRITVRSTPGAGAEFIVELPLTSVAEEAPRAGTPDGRAQGPVRSVLIVDDEPSIRGALAGFLGSLGHAPDAVGSGGEALERMRDRRYDAVLLDLRMPDMSGTAVYEAVKAADPGQAARVVFVTGDVQSDSARAFIRATGRPCLSKPFLLDDVAQVLSQGWSE